jgi:hypothetical protein
MGKVRISKQYVVSITYEPCAIDEYYSKYEATKDSTSASDFYQLACWARKNGLNRFVRPLLQKVIVLDPNHEFARRELGYKFFKGKWMTEEEVMLEKGFVKFEGEWVTTAERELILKKRADRKEQKERERLEAKRKAEERQKAAEEAKKKAAESLHHLEEFYGARGVCRRHTEGSAFVDVTNLPWFWNTYQLWRNWGWPNWYQSGFDFNKYSAPMWPTMPIYPAPLPGPTIFP